MPDLPNELTRLVLESAVHCFLFEERKWVLSLRRTCHTIKSWLHPLIFADLIVTRSNAASFLLLLDAVDPAFFRSTRSVNLLLLHLHLSVEFFTRPNFVRHFAHVQRWFCSLRIVQHMASILGPANFRPTVLGICDDLWLLMPNTLVHLALRNVTHLRLMSNIPLQRTGLQRAPFLEYVVLDVLHDRCLLENVQTLLSIVTLRRVVVLLHVNRGVGARIAAQLSVIHDARMHIALPDTSAKTLDHTGLIDRYEDEMEHGIDHWHAGLLL